MMEGGERRREDWNNFGSRGGGMGKLGLWRRIGWDRPGDAGKRVATRRGSRGNKVWGGEENACKGDGIWGRKMVGLVGVIAGAGHSAGREGVMNTRWGGEGQGSLFSLVD